VIKVMKDLLYQRRLWKMVFEIADHTPLADSERLFSVAKDVVAKSGFEYAEVSSTNYLTRFRPREGNGPSTNYLRLIKKDDRQFPRVVPIEDFSTVISESSRYRFFLRRLYVEGGKDDKGRLIPDVLKRAVSDAVRS